MASFPPADGSLCPYPREHPQWALNPGTATQDDQERPLSSGDGSSNYFDTPEESISSNMSFGTREDEFHNPYGHSDDSISNRYAPQGLPTNFETTINPACLILGHQDSDGQGGFCTPSSSSASEMTSTQDISPSGEDGGPSHQEMGSQLRSASREDIGRRFGFNARGPSTFENGVIESLHLNQIEAIIPETQLPLNSSNLFLRPQTLSYNDLFNLPEQSSTPVPGGFQVQNTQWEASRSSSNDPWTPLTAIFAQEYQPGLDEVMFDLNDALDTGGLPFARRAAFQEREAGNGEHVDGLPFYRLIHGDEDVIDEPPTGDPVGPPIGNLGNPPFGPERPQNPNRPGRRGRLDEETAKSARLMRVIGVCWPCRLLKYRCDPNSPCLRCRRARHHSTFHLECIRAPLPELTEIFLPANLMAQHKAENLRQFVKRHVQSWTRNSMTCSVTWGYGRPIKVEVKEFKPKGDFLLLQSQYRWNMLTNEYITVRVPSPPIGIVRIDSNDWQKKLDALIDWEVEENFAGFPEQCFRGRQFDVQKDILDALQSHHVALKQSARSQLGPEFMRTRASILIRSCETMKICLKLLIITHIMTRTLTLVESTKKQVYSQLQCPPAEAFGVHTSSRMLNKELKYVIAPLYQDVLTKFLEQVHNALLGDKYPSWATILGSLLTLAMTMESVQVSVRCKEATDKCDKAIPEDSNAATLALALMEEKWEFLVSLFHKAYPRLKPIQREEHRKRLDTPSQELAQRIKDIIEKNREFLESRQVLGPPLTSKDPNNSRLIAKLLLSL